MRKDVASGQTLLIVANFDANAVHVGLRIPAHAYDFLKLKTGKCTATDLLTGQHLPLELNPDEALYLSVPAYGAVVLSI